MKQITISIPESTYNRLLATCRRRHESLPHFLLKKIRPISQGHPRLAELPLHELLQQTKPAPNEETAGHNLRRDLFY